MSAYKALIFDSGVGGASIMQALRQACPSISISYLVDNAEYPYGTKSDDHLQQRIVQVCQAVVKQQQPDILIIACNTASTLALDSLRSILHLPVVGVVPAIKVAAEKAREKNTQGQPAEIGLLATQATVNRHYIDELCHDFAKELQVNRFGSHQLVDLAERFVQGQDIHQELINHLKPWIDQLENMHFVVLGCTHFPLLRPMLESIWPTIEWIDSGEAIARRVKALLSITTEPQSLSKMTALTVSPPIRVILTNEIATENVTAYIQAQNLDFEIHVHAFSDNKEPEIQS